MDSDHHGRNNFTCIMRSEAPNASVHLPESYGFDVVRRM